MKTNFCLIALLALTMNLAAQNPYPEENEEYAYFKEVKFAGQKPGITDFVTSYIGDEPEDELTGLLYTMWQKYLKNKPMDTNEKVTVDARNGFVCFEKTYPADSDGLDGGRNNIEMCYWNCSDGNHKIFAVSVAQYHNGKAIQTEFGGITFGIYNNSTHKIFYNNGVSLGIDDIKTGMENLSCGVKDGDFYVENIVTGERKSITEEEYDKWWENYPVITFNLPRTGKDITAVINNLREGKKEVLIKWNGLKFEVQQ